MDATSIAPTGIIQTGLSALFLYSYLNAVRFRRGANRGTNKSVWRSTGGEADRPAPVRARREQRSAGRCGSGAPMA